MPKKKQNTCDFRQFTLICDKIHTFVLIRQHPLFEDVVCIAIDIDDRLHFCVI